MYLCGDKKDLPAANLSFPSPHSSMDFQAVPKTREMQNYGQLKTSQVRTLFLSDLINTFTHSLCSYKPNLLFTMYRFCTHSTNGININKTDQNW